MSYAIGEVFWGFQMSLVAAATVLTVLLSEYGAGKRMIGSIMSIEQGLLLIPQILGVYLFTSRKKRKRNLVIWHFILIIPFTFLPGVFLLLAEYSSDTFTRWGLLLSFACAIFANGAIISVWLDWIAHLFKANIRGTVMGVSLFAAASMGTSSGLLAGWLLKQYPGRETFMLLYFGAGIFASLSMIAFWFIDDPAEADADIKTEQSVRDIFRGFRKSLLNSNFRAFLAGRIIASMGFCIIPFIALHYRSVEGGALDNGTVVSCGAAITFGMALAYLLLGRIGDNFGHRIGIIIGTLAQIAALSIMLISSGWISCALAYFGAGISGSSAVLSHSNMLFETCLHDNRVAHITIGNLLVSLPLIVAPILAGAFAEVWGIRRLLLICLFLSAIAVIWFILFVKEPRRVHSLDPQYYPNTEKNM